MRWSFRIGTIAGVRVELHVTFLIFIGWIALSSGLTTGSPMEAVSSVTDVLLVFACVLLHELGHATAARRYGIATRDIVLLPIGGVARLERMPEKPSEELVVALGGPAVNVVIVAALLLAGVRPVGLARMRDSASIPELLLLVNMVMILFNMIPAFPMDGGRVLRALLAMRLPFARATRIAAGVGQGIALLFGLAGLFVNNFMLMFIALFVFLAAGEERVLVERRTSLSGVSVRDAMVTDFRWLDARETLQRAVDFLMAGSQQDFPVIEHGVSIGVLGRADLVRALQKHGSGAPAGEVVARDGENADAAEPLEAAVRRMRERGRSALPVFEHGAMVGLLTLDNVGDLLVVRAALKRYARA